VKMDSLEKKIRKMKDQAEADLLSSNFNYDEKVMKDGSIETLTLVLDELGVVAQQIREIITDVWNEFYDQKYDAWRDQTVLDEDDVFQGLARLKKEVLGSLVEKEGEK
jgi:hypothetical protein